MERRRRERANAWDSDPLRTAALTQCLFREAATAWLETRKPYLSARSVHDYEAYIRTLSSFFSELRLTEIKPDHVRAYQRMRQARAGAHKINQEVGVIQQLLKRIGRWQDVSWDYQRLPVRKESPGRALTDQECERLFRVAASRPEWEMAYLFAVLSVNTTAGPKECWTLRHQDINLEEGFFRVQPEGAKNINRVRIIPLNPLAQAAIVRILELARSRGSSEPEHYIFPFRINGGATWGVYDPNKHCTTCNSAWRKLRTAAGLPRLRPYDLRHTAITTILQDPEVSEETAKSIAGHISKNILKTYSHIRLDAKRAALDALCRKAFPVRKRLY